MSRILVTGATGRVAGHIARSLAADGDDVAAVARFSDPAARDALESAGVECITVDLGSDLSAVPTDADTLLNFAVSWSHDWDEALHVNAEVLGLLVDRLPKLERLLHCSTSGVYAPSPEIHDETAPLGDPTAASMPTYSISKIAAETMARYLARSRGLPTTIARLNAAYGTHGGIPYFHLLSILQGDAVPLHNREPNAFNLIHEDDLAASVPLLLDAASVPATTVNWCDPEVVSAEEWCAELGRIVGRDVEFTRNEGAPPPVALDASELVGLGYRASVDWRVGLRAMVEHHHPDEIPI